MKHSLLYGINLIVFFFVCTINVQAQGETADKKTKDSTSVKLKYGLRVGADISKLVRTAIDDDYKGFEIVADFRIKKRLYIAGEIGTEEKNTITDYMNISSQGSYLKAGVDYNMYENWLDMDNMIYFGFRAGASTFSHDLNSATVYATNQYWAPQLTLQETKEFNGLLAFWGEIQLGLKAEVLTNLYIGVNLQLRFLASETAVDNFENVYIPGFGKTYDSSRIGAGYGFIVSYRVPFFKK